MAAAAVCKPGADMCYRRLVIAFIPPLLLGKHSADKYSLAIIRNAITGCGGVHCSRQVVGLGLLARAADTNFISFLEIARYTTLGFPNDSYHGGPSDRRDLLISLKLRVFG